MFKRVTSYYMTISNKYKKGPVVVLKNRKKFNPAMTGISLLESILIKGPSLKRRFNRLKRRLLSILLVFLMIIINIQLIAVPTLALGTAFQQGEGYQVGEYDLYAAQPTTYNWTRQSHFNGPQQPVLKWALACGSSSSIKSSPSIGSDGTVYVGIDQLYSSCIAAVSPEGNCKWGFPVSYGYSFGYSSPSIGSDGTVYVGSGNQKILALNSQNGTKKWSFNSVDNFATYSSPSIGSDGTIYIVSGHYLYAINRDGTLKWIFSQYWQSFTSPAIGSGGTIYIGGECLYAINPNGSKKWSYITGSEVYSPTIGSDGTIYVGSKDHNLHAINPDGTKKWIFHTDGEITSSPAISSDDTVYVCSEDRKLYAINLEGIQKWSFQVDEVNTSISRHATPIIGANGTIYACSTHGKLYAINPDGTKKWDFQTGGEIYSSPAIGSDGTIYVGSGDGKLYAIGETPNPSPPENSPLADFKYDVSERIPGYVTFDATEVFNPNYDYNWTINDRDSNGITKEVKLSGPLNTYKFGYSDDPYTVMLTVTDKSGQKPSASKTEEIFVFKPIVILVPGTMGSVLTNNTLGTDIVVWNDNISVDIASINTGILNLNDNGTSILDTSATDIIHSAYDPLIKTLKDAGYLVITFPYDWRLDVGSNAEKLKEKVDQVLIGNPGTKKVNLVAHSQGGLVAKTYLKRYSGEGKINKYVSLAVPQLGTPASFIPWLTGNPLLGSDFLSSLESQVVQNFGDFIKMGIDGAAKNSPSVYEMFPSRKYFSVYNGYYGDFFKVIDNFDDMNNWFTNDLINGTNKLLIQMSTNLHETIDNLDDFDITTQSTFDGYEIVAQGRATPMGITGGYTNEGLIDISSIKFLTMGDNTVPTFSATNGKKPSSSTPYTKTFFTDVPNPKYGDKPETSSSEQINQCIYYSTPHGSLACNGWVDTKILNILNGYPDTAVTSFQNSPYSEELNGTFFNVDCPVELSLTDSKGNEVNKFSPTNGSIDSWYLGESKSAFIYDQSFTAKLTGTGSGNAKISIKEYQNGGVVKTEVYEIPVQINSIAEVIRNAETDELKEDFNGDGIFEDTLKPLVVENDNTPPVLNAELVGNEFSKEDVAINISATDDQSVDRILFRTNGGLYQFVSGKTINFTNEGSYKVEVVAADMAGNISEPKIFSFIIDKTAPTISGATTTAPNSSGWYKSDATVHFTATDALSGIDTITPDTVVSTEGVNQSVTGTATDKAGNSSTATVSGISIDKTAPVIQVQGIEDGGVYILNQKVISNCTAVDDLSGVDNIDSSLPRGTEIDTSTLGSHQYTIKATDKAGNSSEKVITYYVKYDYSGILQPISLSGTSVFKLGSTIPVKFTLKDANMNYIENAVANIFVAKLCDNVIDIGEYVEVPTVTVSFGNEFRYDSTDNQYIYNLSTKNFSEGQYLITIKLNDGQSYSTKISLK